MNIQEFFNEYNAKSRLNPVTDNERLVYYDAVKGNICTVEVKPFDNNTVYLSSIASYPHGTGAGREGLKFLCNLADKHGVPIMLSVKRFGRNGLSNRKLTAWYRRNGFKQKKGYGMVREPVISN